MNATDLKETESGLLDLLAQATAQVPGGPEVRVLARASEIAARAVKLERIARAAAALNACVLPGPECNFRIMRSYGGQLALIELRMALKDIATPATGRSPNAQAD